MWGRWERSGSPFRRFVISEWRLLCEISDPEDEKMTKTTKVGQIAAANKSCVTIKYFSYRILEQNLSYLPRINSLKSAETVSVRRWCSLSPDRHEIRQKRKWLVGRGWCQALNIGGQKGAPSPSTAERQSWHDSPRPQWKKLHQQPKREKTLNTCLVNFSATRSQTFLHFFKRDYFGRNYKSTSNSLN